MAAAIVTIICIAMIVVGGMTLSQGILTTTDSTALNVEAISIREGEMLRTDIDVLRASQLSWGNNLRVTVKNSGQIKLASYDKWDIIVSYEDGDGQIHSEWLPYTTGLLEANEWQKARIGLNGPVEYFEPGILNPGEELVILANLAPTPGDATTSDVSITTPNGIYDSILLVNPGFLRLTPQGENIAISGTKYYELVEAAAADGPALIMGTEFAIEETGRKPLFSTADTSRPARFIYPLTGISRIPSEDWTINYRVYINGGGESFPQADGDIQFNTDILIRQADGAVRNIIATGVAQAFMNVSDKETWVTISGTYIFPEYFVIDENDYLEIVFYGETSQPPEGAPVYLQLSIDDSSLPLNDQTRIEAL